MRSLKYANVKAEQLFGQRQIFGNQQITTICLCPKTKTHFTTDITHITTTVTAFEISSLGNVSSENKKRLTALHKFCKPGIKLSMFVKNISCLSIYSSYHIWLCRNDPVFVTPPYLPAPFQSSLESEP